MRNLTYRQVLDYCGYNESEANEMNLIDCFLDYVDSGCFHNLTYDEAKQDIEDGLISTKQMMRNLMRT